DWSSDVCSSDLPDRPSGRCRPCTPCAGARRSGGEGQVVSRFGLASVPCFHRVSGSGRIHRYGSSVIRPHDRLIAASIRDGDAVRRGRHPGNRPRSFLSGSLRMSARSLFSFVGEAGTVLTDRCFHSRLSRATRVLVCAALVSTTTIAAAHPLAHPQESGAAGSSATTASPPHQGVT